PAAVGADRLSTSVRAVRQQTLVQRGIALDRALDAILRRGANLRPVAELLGLERLGEQAVDCAGERRGVAGRDQLARGATREGDRYVPHRGRDDGASRE